MRKRICEVDLISGDFGIALCILTHFVIIQLERMIEDRAKQAEAERLRATSRVSETPKRLGIVDENSLHAASEDRIKNLAHANFWSHLQMCKNENRDSS